MREIKALSDEIVNQIAAGEVIEGPSAVVKELVENSLDAGAKTIEVELEGAGMRKILVKDDGFGILKDSLERAPQRHATSKIQSFEDLYSINSMGFRGEALASIFSISKAKIISKEQNQDEAYEISSEDLQIKKSASGVGTQVHVHELFHNTPARRKYLKSENLELKEILEVMKRFQLVHFDKSFSLKHNTKFLINKSSFQSSYENLVYVLGNELKGKLFEVNLPDEHISIKGFIGNPSELSYSFRKNQFLFVNTRFVKSKLINNAIYEGFGTNLMENRHPLFVLFIEIDPEIIDVNVHPTKVEIKFEDEETIYERVREAVQKVFEKEELFKNFETEKKEVNSSLDRDIDEIVQREEKKVVNNNSKYFSKETQKDLSFQEEFSDYEKTKTKTGDKEVPSEELEEQAYGPLYETLKDYRIVGQVNKTFVILETAQAMIVVDQHVAEEKFYFETFKENLEKKNPQKQVLLKAEVLKISSEEMLLFKEHKELLERLGYECEEFGSQELMVRAVPVMFKTEQLPASLVQEILHEISADSKFIQLEEKKLEKLASMSCRKSIKAGHEMTEPEIRVMIENLKRLKEPFNCPHGRPILLKYPFSELEKKFKRIV